MELPEGWKKMRSDTPDFALASYSESDIHEALDLLKEMAEALAPFAFEAEDSKVLENHHFENAEKVFQKFREWR